MTETKEIVNSGINANDVVQSIGGLPISVAIVLIVVAAFYFGRDTIRDIFFKFFDSRALGYTQSIKALEKEMRSLREVILNQNVTIQNQQMEIKNLKDEYQEVLDKYQSVLERLSNQKSMIEKIQENV